MAGCLRNTYSFFGTFDLKRAVNKLRSFNLNEINTDNRGLTYLIDLFESGKCEDQSHFIVLKTSGLGF